jgi:CsoR family transcriptional regulator, copper-sensing transcriptional repressor
MNITAKLAATPSKRWYAGQRPTGYPPAQTVRALIRKKRYPVPPRWDHQTAAQAAAPPAAALAEQDNHPGRAPGMNGCAMKINKSEAKEQLLLRLKRIEGQVRGVQAMVSEERDCQDIIQQLSAIRSAVQGVSRVFLQEYAAACLLEMDQKESGGTISDEPGRREKMVRDMIELLDKAP